LATTGDFDATIGSVKPRNDPRFANITAVKKATVTMA